MLVPANGQVVQCGVVPREGTWLVDTVFRLEDKRGYLLVPRSDSQRLDEAICEGKRGHLEVRRCLGMLEGADGC